MLILRFDDMRVNLSVSAVLRQHVRDIGDPRLWSEIISLCEQWMTEGGELECTKKDYKCCHHMPTLGPSTATKVSEFLVPPLYTWSFSSTTS